MSYSSLKTEVEKYSYCLGLDMASRIKGLAVEVNKEAFLDAIKSILDDEKQDISNEEYNEVLSRLFKLFSFFYIINISIYSNSITYTMYWWSIWGKICAHNNKK